jgi:O-antigen ligase
VAAVATIAGLLLLLTAADVRTVPLVLGPPLLALPIFLVIRNRIDRRLTAMIALSLAVFLLEAVFRVRAYDEKTIDFQILIKVGSWLILLAIAAMSLGRMLRVITSTGCLPWTLLFLYFLLTSLWAPNFLHSAVAALSILSFYIFFASLSGSIRNDDVLLAMLAGILLLAVASLLLYVLIPSFARMHVWAGTQQVLSGRLSGLAGHPNTIGRLCCFGILVAVNQWRNLKQFGRMAPFMVVALLGITLLLSNSRTSIGITCVLLAIYLFARARNLPYLLLFVAGAALAFIVLEPYAEGIMRMLSRSGDAEEIATGTSRTHIWAVVKLLIAERPVLGWGYGSSVFIMPQYARFMGHAAPHAHNMLLQLWLTTGFVGLAGFLVAVASRFAIAVRESERFTIILLLFVVLNGLSESSAFGGVANITTVALCFAATSFMRGRQDAPAADSMESMAGRALR